MTLCLELSLVEASNAVMELFAEEKWRDSSLRASADNQRSFSALKERFRVSGKLQQGLPTGDCRSEDSDETHVSLDFQELPHPPTANPRLEKRLQAPPVK